MSRTTPENPHAELVIDRMWRVDTDDDSTIHCACGASFSWEGFDPGLDAWLQAHEAHVPRTSE
jgi:hypothetical protein